MRNYSNRAQVAGFPAAPAHRLRRAGIEGERLRDNQRVNSKIHCATAQAPKTADDPVTVLLASAGRRRRLAYEAERDALEDALVSAAADDGDAAAAIAERLGEVEEALEECDADLLRADATRTLKDVLGFSPKRLATPVRDLSGGWRARVALGAALLAKSDVLLLDEPTNHLDLDAVFRLEKYLLEEGANGKADAPTLFFVSHDRAFVEAVATDVVVFENCALTYFRGGLAEFERRNEEKAANQEKRLDARVRQETAARESAERLKRTAAQKKGNRGGAVISRTSNDPYVDGISMS